MRNAAKRLYSSVYAECVVCSQNIYLPDILNSLVKQTQIAYTQTHDKLKYKRKEDVYGRFIIRNNF